MPTSRSCGACVLVYATVHLNSSQRCVVDNPSRNHLLFIDAPVLLCLLPLGGRYLRLSDNRLTGTIPVSINSMGSMLLYVVPWLIPGTRTTPAHR